MKLLYATFQVLEFTLLRYKQSLQLSVDKEALKATLTWRYLGVLEATDTTIGVLQRWKGKK